MAQNERQVIHSNLKQELVNELTNEEFDELKEQVLSLNISHLKKGKLSRMTKINELLRELESSGHFGVGKYDTLRKLLEQCGRSGATSILDKAEEKLGNLACEVDSTNGKVRKFPMESGLECPATKRKRLAETHSKPITTVDSEVVHKETCYPMKPNEKGLLILIENFSRERRGSHNDCSQLKSFFVHNLGYDLKEQKDLKLDGFKGFLAQVKDHIAGKSPQDMYKCLVIAVLSHGDEHGIKTMPEQQSANNRETYIKVEDIMDYFTGENLKCMNGRPKICLVQACRGNKLHAGIVRADSETDEDNIVETGNHDQSTITIPAKADLLVAYATVEGYPALRDEAYGSWFIQVLIHKLQKYYKSEDLLSILTTVNNKVAKFLADGPCFDRGSKYAGLSCKQMPCFLSTLRKKLYLS